MSSVLFQRSLPSHATKSDNEDVLKVCQVVMKNNIVVKQEENRKHSSHPKISCDPLSSLDKKKNGEMDERKI